MHASSSLDEYMVSETEFLENATKVLKACPMCGATQGYKISGWVVKSLECNGCKAKWIAVTVVSEWGWTRHFEPEGEHWLMLESPSNVKVGKTNVGKYLVNKPFPLEVWLSEDKPFLKCETYATTILEAFKKLENAPYEMGRAFFREETNVLLLGPSKDFVGKILPVRPDITVAVIDYTQELKEKANEENDFFYFMVSDILQKLSEKVPLTPYISIGKETKKVTENVFYPYKEREVTIPEALLPYFARADIVIPSKVH